jgi:hypothetical protein
MLAIVSHIANNGVYIGQHWVDSMKHFLIAKEGI